MGSQDKIIVRNCELQKRCRAVYYFRIRLRTNLIQQGVDVVFNCGNEDSDGRLQEQPRVARVEILSFLGSSKVSSLKRLGYGNRYEAQVQTLL